MSTHFDEHAHARDAAGKFAPHAGSEPAVTLDEPDQASGGRAAHSDYRHAVIDSHGAAPRHVIYGVDVANTSWDRLPPNVQDELSARRADGTTLLVAPDRHTWPRQGRVRNGMARLVEEHEENGGSIKVTDDGSVRWLDRDGQPGRDVTGDPDGRACGWDPQGQPDLWSHGGRVVPRTRQMATGAVFAERLDDGAQHEFLVGHGGTVVEHVYTDRDGRMHNPHGPAVVTENMVEFAEHGMPPKDRPGRVHTDGSVQFLDEWSRERHPGVIPEGVEKVGRDYRLSGVGPDAEVDLTARFGDPWRYADRGSSARRTRAT